MLDLIKNLMVSGADHADLSLYDSLFINFISYFFAFFVLVLCWSTFYHICLHFGGRR